MQAKNNIEKKRKCALYFGSFNPLHYGHLRLAEYVMLHCNIDRFIMVLSPHNPFKDSAMLQDAGLRLKALQKAVEEFNTKYSETIANSASPTPKCKKIEISEIEFNLQEPLYTIVTMAELQKQMPDYELVIVTGADSFKSMPRWHRGEELLRKYQIIVYPRKGYKVKTLARKYKALYLEDAPLYDISSTQIRENGQKYGQETI